MARINGLIGTNLTGSAGKLTFTMVNGQNIMKQKASVVKNPRTTAQQNQRMKFKTLTNSYAASKEVTDHSFEGVQYGANSMNYFKKINQYPIFGSDRFVAQGLNIVAPSYGIQISNGSIPATNYSGLGEGVENTGLLYGIKETQTIATMTVAQLLNMLNLKRGQQYTFLAIGYVGGATSFKQISATTWQPTQHVKRLVRFVIAQTALDSTLAFAPADDEGKIHLAPAILDSENSLLASALIFEKMGNNLLQISYDSGEFYALAGAIISEKANMTWKRSTQYFVECSLERLNLLLGTLHDGASISFEPNDVINTYNPTSPYYLNNAEV